MKQCSATTLNGEQCKKETAGEHCYLHTMSERVKQLYKDAEKRSRDYIRYVERERRKHRLSHQKYMQTSLCKAVTRKGFRCQVAADKYCRVHQHLDRKPPVSVDDAKAQLMSEARQLADREYSGNETRPAKLRKIREAYENETYTIKRAYDDAVLSLSPASDLDAVRSQLARSAAQERGFTDEDVEDIEQEEDSEVDLLIAQLEKTRDQIRLREFKGPHVDSDYTQERIAGYYQSEVRKKTDNINGMIRSISMYKSLEAYGTAEEVTAEAEAMMKHEEKTTDQNAMIIAKGYLNSKKARR